MVGVGIGLSNSTANNIFKSSSSLPSHQQHQQTNSKSNLEDFIYELKQRNEQQEDEDDLICRPMIEEMMEKHLHDVDQAVEAIITIDGNSSTATTTDETDANSDQSSRIAVDNGHNHQHNNNGISSSSTSQSSTLHHSNNHHHDYSSSSANQALLTLLAKKEKDLILAAELGKALLDRNEELSRTNEQLNEEYTRNIELLEQEKYALRKKLNSIEIEYENKIHDLQADLQTTRENLNAHLEISKQNEAQNSKIIKELTEQNRRLTIELKESSSRESSLEKEIQSLKEQYTARRTNFTDHIGQLEGLRDEINLLSNRKRDLEQKISSLNEEKESMSITLDESQYRILSLEKQLFEKESQLQNQQKDLEELRRMNIQYQNKIDSLMKTKCFMTDGMMPHASSLYNEIEISSHSSSCDEIDMFTQGENAYCLQCSKTKQEMGDLYNKLKQLCDDLTKRRQSECPNDQGGVAVSSNSSTNSHDSGIQTSMMDELNMIVCDIQDLIKSIDFMQCLSCHQFNLERNELDRLQKKSAHDKEEIFRLNNEIMKLTSDSTIQEAELAAMKERNKVLEQDAVDMKDDLSQDEIVKRALKMRDETISRKNAVEIELAKIRIELMHVNSQLLETIQQKVELSQQLEQWQVDMEILIEEQLKSKLSLHEKKSTTSSSTTSFSSSGNNGAKKENIFGLISFSKLLSHYQR